MKIAKVLLIAAVFIAAFVIIVQAEDGTQGTISTSQIDNRIPAGSYQKITDEDYTLTPFESVSISASSVWADNRHRAYYSTGTGSLDGFLLFDLTQIPDNADILSLNLLCYLENQFGSPMANPVVDIYWSDDDNWSRTGVSGGQLSLNELLVDNVLFSTYVPTYNFQLNVFNHDWSIDLADNQLCLGFRNDTQIYSYVYFYGAYGAPTGPAPVLTITTWNGITPNVSVDLTPATTPIIIPANGGAFDYDAVLTNLGTASADCHVWINATMPAGSTYGPIIARSMANFAGGSVITRSLTQNVPAAAPAGLYTMNAYVGVYPDVVFASDSFTFTKSADRDDSGYEVADWNSGDGVMVDEVRADSYSLTAAPNPFNPATTLSVNLEKAGGLRLYIFDIQGRLVRKMAEGYYNAGIYDFQFDGSGLADGIYFAKLEAGGIVKTSKLILLK